MVEQRTAALDSVFHALADATRRSILREITRHERTVGELAEPYKMSLERASLIERERRGTSRVVRLNPKPLRAAQHWLAYYEAFWSSTLDRLQSHLESTQPSGQTAGKKEN